MAKNPAWEPLLNIIPAEFHSQVEPLLEQWDQGVNQRFASYAPYKNVVEAKVDPEYLEMALRFANDFDRDPVAMINTINQKMELGFVSQEEARQISSSNSGEDIFGSNSGEADDLLNSPAFKEIREQLQTLVDQRREEDEEAEREAALEAYEKEITDFLQDKGNVNKLFFTGLRTAGLSNEEAWNQYQQTVAQMINGNQELPPGEQPPGQAPNVHVMGGDGNVGAGQVTEPVNFSKLSNDALDDVVIQMLKTAEGN